MKHLSLIAQLSLYTLFAAHSLYAMDNRQPSSHQTPPPSYEELNLSHQIPFRSDEKTDALVPTTETMIHSFKKSNATVPTTLVIPENYPTLPLLLTPTLQVLKQQIKNSEIGARSCYALAGCAGVTTATLMSTIPAEDSLCDALKSTCILGLGMRITKMFLECGLSEQRNAAKNQELFQTLYNQQEAEKRSLQASPPITKEPTTQIMQHENFTPREH